MFSAREKIVNSFKSRLFPIKNLERIPLRQPAAESAAESTKHKKCKLKMEQEFINEIIAEERGIDNEIFLDYFKYQNPSLLVKDLISV